MNSAEILQSSVMHLHQIILPEEGPVLRLCLASIQSSFVAVCLHLMSLVFDPRLFSPLTFTVWIPTGLKYPWGENKTSFWKVSLPYHFHYWVLGKGTISMLWTVYVNITRTSAHMRVCRTILLENTNDLFLTLSLLKLYRENCGEYQQPTQEAGGWGVRRWRIEGGGFSIKVITISWTHKCIPNRAYYLTTLLKKGVTVPSLTAPCDLLMYVAYVRKSPKPAPREHRWKFIQSWTYTHMHTYVYFLASETVNQIWGYLLHWKLNW